MGIITPTLVLTQIYTFSGNLTLFFLLCSEVGTEKVFACFYISTMTSLEVGANSVGKERKPLDANRLRAGCNGLRMPD